MEVVLKLTADEANVIRNALISHSHWLTEKLMSMAEEGLQDELNENLKKELILVSTISIDLG